MNSSASFRHAQLPEDQEGSPDEIWEDEQARRTTVVHVNSPLGFDVYIGRAVRRRGFEGSKWQNPFPLAMGTREEVIEAFRKHLLASPELLAALPELKGKRLACWCRPLPCHGDVLVEMIEALP